MAKKRPGKSTRILHFLSAARAARMEGAALDADGENRGIQ
jgi:hypothetical protein